MYAKPCVILVPILHILIPDKKWTGKHLLWSLDIIQEFIWKVWQNFGVFGFISPSKFPIFNFKKLYVWLQTLDKPYLPFLWPHSANQYLNQAVGTTQV